VHDASSGLIVAGLTALLQAVAHALAPVPALGQMTIPLCTGLTMVGAVSEPEGDYEPIVTVESMSAQGIDLKYSTQVRTGSSIRTVNVRRTVLHQDMQAAGLLVHWFDNRAPRTIPGTTAIGPSVAVLRALKTSGVAEMGIIDRSNSTLPGDRDVHPNVWDYEMKYTLRRVGSGAVSVPITVNGVKTALPAIRAQGEHVGDRAEFLFLDNERNPLQLGFRLTSSGATEPVLMSTTVKISFRCSEAQGVSTQAPPSSRLERELMERGRVDVYDIYFDFNSDRIREQSEPTLREIAELLRRHQQWTLMVEGHTDNVASDVYNLELSQRRAAAVKAALVGRYGVAEERLTTTGFGESNPRDRNDTLEGRARNRRVELVCDCGGRPR
jgi:outer membrane protein OmpA-like peptidoglycan-associated protein